MTAVQTPNTLYFQLCLPPAEYSAIISFYKAPAGTCTSKSLRANKIKYVRRALGEDISSKQATIKHQICYKSHISFWTCLPAPPALEQGYQWLTATVTYRRPNFATCPISTFNLWHSKFVSLLLREKALRTMEMLYSPISQSFPLKEETWLFSILSC